MGLHPAVVTVGTVQVEINPDFEKGTVIRTDPPANELRK